MEDPWGSPWATPDNDTNGQHPPTDAKPEPPPPAFFSSTPNNLNLPSSQSAWLEDESYGDWASPEAVQPAATSWGAWGASDTTPSESGQLTPRFESKRKASIPKWPSSRSTSPGQRTGPLSKKPSSDHLSHDPWASEYSSNDRDPESTAPLTEIQHLPPLPTAHGMDLSPTKLRSRASDISITINSPRPVHTPSNGSASPDKDSVAERSALPELRVEPAASPTTSTSDGDGLQDTAREESPITPVDDSQTGANGDRKASKVHQLVEMFDGIARKSSVPLELALPPKRSASQSPVSFETDASQTDESESSGPTSDDANLPGQGHPTSTATLNPANVIDDPGQNAAVALEAHPTDTPVPDIATSEEASDDENEDSVIITTEVTDHDPFHIDLEHLDKLFDFPASKVTGTDVEVPDRVITDSFESVSERRMWYRISRYESLRRYDAGNDDNYARITWTSSTVRSDVMKTVRRWMEEDSIGRRPFRTGLAKGVGGHGFGWDKASTQVDLEKFFGRKRPDQAATAVPTPRLSMSGLPPHAAAMMHEPRPMSLPPPVANANSWDGNGQASFGWSSDANDGQLAVGKPNPPLPDGWGSQTGEVSKQQPTAAAQSTTASKSLVIQTKQLPVEDDDDDEWGDMVTPSIDEFPNAAGPQEQAQPVPVADRNIWGLDGWEEDTTTRIRTQQSAHQVVLPEKLLAADAKIPTPPTSSVQHNTAQDADIVARFVQNLPDLSYMLR